MYLVTLLHCSCSCFQFYCLTQKCLTWQVVWRLMQCWFSFRFILLIYFLKQRWNGGKMGGGASASPISNDYSICQQERKELMVRSLSAENSLQFFLFNFLFSSCFLFVGFCNLTLSSMSKSWLRLVVIKMEPTIFVH